MKRWFLIFFMVYCLSILNTPLGNKYRNSFWKRAVYCIIKCYSRCKCSEGLGKMLLTGTAYESMWNCCLPCLPGKSCCCPGVLTESCWVIDGVNHGKASLSAACSRRRVAEVMPSSGHGAGTALPGAVTSLCHSCWNAERQQQPARKGWRWWHDDPGWTRSVLSQLLQQDGWVGLPHVNSVEAGERVPCAWNTLQKPSSLIE